MNVINGGAHANNSLRIQEFMIRPDAASNFKEAINLCFLVIQKLKTLISGKNLPTTLGDEGGFAPSLANNEEAIEFILEAIQISKDENILFAKFFKKSHLLLVLSVILAFKRTVGIFFFLI